MPKSTATCNKILALIFNGTAWTDIAENDTSSPLASLYLALHTADPGVGNNQTTNETAYTNYDRVQTTRVGTTDWTAPSSGALSNVNLEQFPECGITGATITWASIGTNDLPDAGNVLYAGELTSPIAVSNQITPQFPAGAIDITET